MPTPEALPTKELILEKIRNEGLNDEIRGLIQVWHEAMRTSESNSRDTVRTLIESSDFYVEARDFDYAEEVLSEAMFAAQQEQDEDLYVFAQGKLVELDKLRD